MTNDFAVTPTLPGQFSDLAARLAAAERRLTVLATTLGDGAAGAPALSFLNDSDTGIFRLGSDRLAFVTAGVVRAYVQSDGTFIVPDTAAGDPTNLTSGTAPGSIVLGQNRALRAINPARTGSTRLVTLGNSDQIVIGSLGTEGGPVNQIALRTSAGNPVIEATGPVSILHSAADQTEFIRLDPTGAYLQLSALGSGATFLTTKRTGDTVARMALLESGRAEYSSGSAGADVIVIPRNAANEWRLATGYIKLDDTSTGALINFAARASSGVPNNSLYVNSTGGKLTFKDGSGVDNALY